MKTYEGILIPQHCVKDKASKSKAIDSLYGWSPRKFTAEAWMRQLEKGHTIQPGVFNPKADGKYTHAEGNWQSTHFIAADGDNFIGVEVNDKGEEANPNGIEPWTDASGLSKRFPEIKDMAYAVAQSVSSMVNEPLHRRYRLIFLFDEPITDGQHYRQILRTLGEQFPLITTVDRQPAQPIFGNATETGTVHIAGNILKLSDYPYTPPAKQEYAPVTWESKPEPDGKGVYNATQRKYKDDIDGLIRDARLTRHDGGSTDAIRVDCPFNSDHKGDAFVKLDTKGYPSFKCHHNSCQGNGFNEMARLTGIEVPYEPMRQAKPPQVSKPQPTHDTMDRPLWTEEDKQTESTTPELSPFPEELFFDVFATYRDAHAGKVPMSDAFCFGSLKHVIASLLGRKYYIETTPTIFPNMFTALIGNSSDSAKGVAVSQANKMLSTAAPCVHRMNSLSTSSGFINFFTTPHTYKRTNDDGEEIELYGGGVAEKLKDQDLIGEMIANMCERESIRNTLFLEEFSLLLAKAKTMNGTGLLQDIMNLYDARDEHDTNTKVDATVAKYPTFSMIATSDKALIEKVMGQEYITGGFTNRFEWYLGHDVESFFLNKMYDQKIWNDAVLEVGGLREKFDQTCQQVPFTMSDAGMQIGADFHKKYSAWLKETQEDEALAADSLRRTKAHVLKNSLMFAIIRNKCNDRVIDAESVRLAITLAQWTTEATQHIFDDFALGESSRIRQRILKTLTRHPGLSANVISNKLKTEDTAKVFKMLDDMVRHRILMVETPKRTELYSVIKEEAI